MAHILSKSTFMYGRQCEKRLYLNKYKKHECDPYDEMTKALFAQGTDVGTLAQQLFPGGADAQADEPFASSKTVARTQQLLPVYSVIYEAAFMHQGVLCAVDILVRKGKKYYAYEVKSTNSVKPQHIQDASLQYHVLQQCGIPLADFSIIHFNRDYVRNGPIEIEKLFTTTSLWDEVQTFQDEIAADIVKFKQILANASHEPEIAMGAHCNTPYACNFQTYCTKLNPPPVVKSVKLDQTIYYDKPALRDFFSDWEYPLHFFDFETIMYGVPEFDFSSPYQQLPFQFSLHIKKSPKSSIEHIEYLGDGVNDPRPDLIERMLNTIHKTGSIVTWYAPFERGCLEKLAKNFPAYHNQIHSIISRMVDLMQPFKNKMVICDAFNNSASLKTVLPIMMPHLQYTDLEIQDGGMASSTYAILSSMSNKEQAKTRQELLDYCKLDTLAMVEIYKALNG
jgi:hypothetical protein